MDIELLTPIPSRKQAPWKQLLLRAGLTPEALPEQTALLWDGDILAATGSRQGNILKYLAVDPSYQGEGLLAQLLTSLRQEAFLRGYRHLFLYTKPENEQLFRSLFFYPVAGTDQVVLMEDRRDGLQRFLTELPHHPTGINAAAAVMNCDPFTLGHQYLIETAAAECERLYVFVLSEDRGRFSAKDRLQMVTLGTAHLPNVTVLPTGPYLISAATFPTYFLKDRDAAGQIHCQLDIALFTQYFVPRFGIRTRYVGTEPLSPMTARYNAALREALPRMGIQVRELPRLTQGNTPVSASAVRKALEENRWEAVQSLVPQTTFHYLQILHQEAQL